MQIVRDLTKTHLRSDSVLTVGTFDGVHLGHQAILRRVLARARETGRLAGAVTFHPHPRSVLSGNAEAKLLTTLGEKIRLLDDLGLDFLVMLPFSRELADKSAEEFVASLCTHLNMRELWVGPDFALGKGREGDVQALDKLGGKLGFTLGVVDRVSQNGQVVSSTQIRALIAQGQVKEAARWLGRNYSATGEVVHGTGRGRQLGFPTANLAVPEEKLLPSYGVYAAYIRLDRTRFAGVVNIGVRPTFGELEPSVEAHILDFDEDIYGRQPTVEFVEFLRAERRFASAEELVAQIGRDCAKAREILDYIPISVSSRESKGK